MRYIGKKLGTMVITILIISFLVFFAFDLIPGDAAMASLGTDATPERIEALREQMGLNRPLIQRYADWLWSFIRGDFGTSYKYKVSVSSLIADKLPITFMMAIISFVMIIVISLPVGIYSVKHQGKWIDRSITVINQILMAIPHFFMGIMLTYVFGLLLKIFTPGDFVSYQVNFKAFIKYLIFPCIAIALPKIATSVKLIKSACLAEAKKDYTRTAYSKGNNTNQVLVKHVLKNALMPVITLWGMMLADLLVGSIVIEQVFNIPGIGRILITSISYRDYPVVEAIIILIAIIIVVTNFLVDVIYQLIDPRISVQE